MWDKKTFKTQHTELTYIVSKYSTNFILKEIERKYQFNKLKGKYPEINFVDYFFKGYNKFQNPKDPVFCDFIESLSLPDKTKESIKNDLSKIILKITDVIEDKSDKILLQKLGVNIKLFSKNNPKEFALMNKKTYYKMKKKLKINHDLIIWMVVYRYQYLGIYNGVQASVPHKIYNYYKEKYNAELELFGSPFNTGSIGYCGLFYDIEKYFGCLGNFFGIQINKGFYLVNPPFVCGLMNKMFNKILDTLNRKVDVSFYIVVPVWNNIDRKKINEMCNKNLRTDYSENFENKILVNSKYLKFNKLHCKKDFPYYDFVLERYINYAPTEEILVSNII